MKEKDLVLTDSVHPINAVMKSMYLVEGRAIVID